MAERMQKEWWSIHARRMMFLFLAVIVISTGNIGQVLVSANAATVPAFNGDSGGGDPPAIVSRLLVAAHLETMSSVPLIWAVHRATFPSGAVLPVEIQPGPTVIFVDAGTVTGRAYGVVTVSGGAAPGAIMGADSQQATGVISLCYGDQVIVPADVAFGAVNEGDAPAVLLVARVLPWFSRNLTPAVEISGSPIAWDLLAQSVITRMPSSPAILMLTRIV
jgi:hypothetical protein